MTGKGAKSVDMVEKIRTVIQEKLSPGIATHGGFVRLVSYENGVVYVELSGACAGCPAADQGTRMWIRDILQAELPNVREVELIQHIDPELLEFARSRLRRFQE